MKLELKHLAPYLPYKLKFVMTADYTEEFGEVIDDLDVSESIFKEGSEWTYSGEVDESLCIPIGDGDISRVFSNGSTYISISCNGIKPILRPLEDLTSEIEINGEFISLPLSELLYSYKVVNGWDYSNVDDLEVWALNPSGSPTEEVLTLKDYTRLFEWHFDVFGLIDKGLAIDINTLK